MSPLETSLGCGTFRIAPNRGLVEGVLGRDRPPHSRYALGNLCPMPDQTGKPRYQYDFALCGRPDLAIRHLESCISAEPTQGQPLLKICVPHNEISNSRILCCL